MKRNRKLLLLAAAAGMAGGALAEAAGPAPVYTLGEVVVTATATPNERARTPASVSVVTREEIEENHYQTLSEALEHVSGIDSVRFAEGTGFEISGESSLTVRGTSSVLVAVDGVIQKTGNGYKSYLLKMNMDDVERIEVLKGAASTIYGADAIGGVVNIITRNPAPGESEGNLTLAAGQYGYKNLHLNHHGGEGDLYWSVSYDKTKKGNYDDGYGKNNKRDVDADAVNLRLGAHLSDATDLTFTYQDTRQEGKALRLVPGRGYRNWAAKYWFRNAGVNLDYHSKDGKESNTFSFLYGKMYSNRRYSSYSSNPNAPVKPWELVDRDNYSITNRYYRQLSDNNRISAGFEWGRYSVATASAPNRSIRETALYVQDEWDVTEKLRLTGGLRYVNSDSYDSQLLNSIALNYKISKAVNFYAASNEFYKTPSTTAIFGSAAFYPNPSIKPEQGRSNEVGFKFDFGHRTDLEIALWDRRYENAIVIQSLEGTRNIYTNTDSVSHVKGGEVNFSKWFGDHVHFGLSYSRLVADNDSQIPRLPKTQWMFDLGYKTDRWDVNLQALNRSDFAPNNYFPAGFEDFLPEKNYWVWNLSANYQIDESWKVFAKVTNLFDKGYMSATQYNSYGIAEDEPWAYYAGQGRAFEIGAAYRF